MSFQNFDQFQNPSPGDGGVAPGAPPTPQDSQMNPAQQGDQAQQQFPGAPTGEPTTPGGTAAGDQKTTLW